MNQTTHIKYPDYISTHLKKEIAGAYSSCTNEDKKIILRLVNDLRMREVYEGLQNHYDDQHIANFFYAAWGATNDFDRYRRHAAEIKNLKLEIKDKAFQLSELIERASSIAHLPHGLTSVAELLWESPSDNEMWSSGLRDELLPHFSSNSSDIHRYYWKKAPSLIDCLKTAAMLTDDITPNTPENLSVSIKSRKKNQSWSYLRNFIFLLLEDYDFEPSFNLSEFIVITTSVVNNTDTEIEVSNIYKEMKNLHKSNI